MALPAMTPSAPGLTRRSSAEKAVNDRLAQTPDLYLLALAQFAIAADTEVASSQSADMYRCEPGHLLSCFKYR